MSAHEHALQIEGLSKTFPGQKALDDVALDVRPGEIHALVGENGSGKSTLIKCLAGFHVPDPGARIAIAGVPLDIPYVTADAIAAGCAFVHQDLALVDSLTVMENLALASGFQTARLGRVKWSAQARRAREHMKVFGDHIHPRTPVERLSQADKTLVAIGRGLADAQEGGRVLVLDEPTAALPASEVETLFNALRKIAATGIGIVYVSHRLTEIFDIADRVTVLRDARKVGTYAVGDLDERRLIELIVGRPLDQYYPPEVPTVREDVVLRVQGLTGHRLQDATFDLHAGEVLGIAGLLGSGRSELARLIFGAQSRVSGEVIFKGTPRDFTSPREAVDAGIAFIPEDRRTMGSLPDMSVRENITLMDLKRYRRAGRLNGSAERREARDLIKRFQVRPPQPEKRFATLSGGNQQKAIVAKWMRIDPELIIFDEPGQGVDIGSRTEIYRLIEQAAARGAAVMVIDSDLEDLCRLCTRILVLRNGELVAALTGAARSRGHILELIYTGERP